MLTVTIHSFSFKRGPHVGSEHGGGFVFDCRCLPNPGREERYRQMSGMDQDVRDYLERHEPVARFAELTYTIVRQAIDNYKEREFSDLLVRFGCTGGQHRSVYLAEQLANHLRRDADVEVRIEHCSLPIECRR